MRNWKNPERVYVIYDEDVPATVERRSFVAGEEYVVSNANYAKEHHPNARILCYVDGAEYDGSRDPGAPEPDSGDTSDVEEDGSGGGKALDAQPGSTDASGEGSEGTIPVKTLGGKKK